MLILALVMEGAGALLQDALGTPTVRSAGTTAANVTMIPMLAAMLIRLIRDAQMNKEIDIRSERSEQFADSPIRALFNSFLDNTERAMVKINK
jgi:hypothetical protein